MEKKLHVRPLGWAARLADGLMVLLMYLLSGTVWEAPQRTHFWNNQKLNMKDVCHLIQEAVVDYDGNLAVGSRWWLGCIPLFHMPVFGGWRVYVVLEPVWRVDEWHVGWVTRSSRGVSRIPLQGPVRMLIGPEQVRFFGIRPDGSQLSIRSIGCGCIGEGGPYSQLPLL